MTGRSLARPPLASSMSRMFSFTRREEITVPNRPTLPTSTGNALPSALAPKIPAMKVLVWGSSPIRMTASSAAPPAWPIRILLLPVVRKNPAPAPMAVLLEPVVLLLRASAPKAVLKLPVLVRRAWTPRAVLLEPVVLLLRASVPRAVLSTEHFDGQRVWAAAGSATARLRAHRSVSDTRIDVMRASSLDLSLGDQSPWRVIVADVRVASVLAWLGSTR